MTVASELYCSSFQTPPTPKFDLFFPLSSISTSHSESKFRLSTLARANIESKILVASIATSHSESDFRLSALARANIELKILAASVATSHSD